MKADKKAHILSIARSCFYCWGIHNVSVDEIARECGMSKKTFYSFFNSRSALVEEIFLKQLQQFELTLNDLTSVAKDAPEELTNFFHLFRTIKIPLIVMHDLRKYYPDVYVQLISGGEQLIKAFIRANIHRGRKERRYRKSGEIETNIVSLVKLFKAAVLDEEGKMFQQAILSNLSGSYC
ncbi:MAG: hypothetical protein DI535_12225 [Citrobacter freundii]|nr:MAG: hypothetical protein DI535_12225 [Citrobacter freundii]